MQENVQLFSVGGTSPHQTFHRRRYFEYFDIYLSSFSKLCSLPAELLLFQWGCVVEENCTIRPNIAKRIGKIAICIFYQSEKVWLLHQYFPITCHVDVVIKTSNSQKLKQIKRKLTLYEATWYVKICVIHDSPLIDLTFKVNTSQLEKGWTFSEQLLNNCGCQTCSISGACAWRILKDLLGTLWIGRVSLPQVGLTA